MGVHARQHGFSMVEVLVALLILSIGLLGLAGMQTRSVQMNQSAAQSSQANFLAYDILDRMRANRNAAVNGDYNRTLTQPVPTATNTLANRDLREWLIMIVGANVEGTAVPGLLPQQPGATGAAVTVSAEGDVTIEIRWYDARWSDDEEEQIRTLVVEGML